VVRKYRRPASLARAFGSVVPQIDPARREVIVIDDDPASSAFDTVKGFDPGRVTLYQTSHSLGLWGTRNGAIGLAHGDWIFYREMLTIWQRSSLPSPLTVLS
jgi:hypothetical protein